jgi:predicted dehydrogenase
MTDQLTAAVVGTGFIGPVHVEGLRRAGIHVAGIAGSSPQRSSDAAARLGLPQAYPSLADILADDAVDAVHLTTPNRFHFEQAKAVLAAGKHVLCEKPLAMSAVESATLVQLAKDSGLAAGVAYNIRYYPLCHEAAARFRNGDAGELLHVNGSYVQDWLLYETDFNWRVVAEDGGALRAVADIGTHWLDLVQFITGRHVIAVCASLQTVHPTRQRPQGGAQTFSGSTAASAATRSETITTEDAGCVMLRLEGDATGCLWVSQTTAGRRNCLRFEIAGSAEALSWNSESPNSLWIGHRDRPNEQLIRDAALLSESAGALCNYPGGHNEGFPDTFKQLFRSFYLSIQSESYLTNPPFPTFLDGHREVVLCEAVLQSHREGRWVDVPSL